MKIYRILSLLLLLLFSITIVKAQDIDIKNINTSEDWENLMASALRNNDLVFVGVHEEGSEAYEDLMRNVYPSDKFKSTYSDRFQVAIMVEETRFRADFAGYWSITDTPSFLIFSPHADRILQLNGVFAADADYLSLRGDQIILQYDELLSGQAKLESGDMSLDELINHILVVNQFYMGEKAKEVAESLFSKIPYDELFDQRLIPTLELAPSGKDSDLFKKIISGSYNLPEVFGYYYDDIIVNIIQTQRDDAVYNESIEDLEFVIENLVPLYFTSANGFEEIEIAQYVYGFRKSYYAYNNDWSSYQSIVMDFFMNRGRELENFRYFEAVEIIENYPTEESLPLAILLLEATESEESNFQNNYALAYSFALLDNKTDALRFAKKAKILASLEGDIEGIDQFIESLNLMD